MKKVNINEMLQIHGGAGYYWNCKDGYQSHKHVFRRTAESNAKAHERLYNTKCEIFYG